MALTKIKTDGIEDDAVTSGKIPANAVGSSELADNAVTQSKIPANAIGTAQLRAGEVTTAKLATGAVNAAKIADNAVHTSNITDQAVTLAKLPHGTSSNNGKFLRANNGADPTFETVSTDLVGDSSPQLGGTLDCNGQNVQFKSGGGNVKIEYDVAADSFDFVDNAKSRYGTGNDLQIYHDGSNSYITHTNNGGDPLYISSQNDIRLRVANTEEGVKVKSNGAVELYHNNGKKVETTTNGIKVTGEADAGGGATSGNIQMVRFDGRKNTIGNNFASNSYDSRIEFGVSDGSTSGGTNRAISISYAGISFGADTASANRLDDYEEGTFTPAFKATGASNNSDTSVQESRYIKIGGLVFVSMFIDMNAHGNSTGGYANITGLPFTSSGRHYPVTIGYWNNLTQNQTIFTGTVQPSSNLILLRHCTGACSGTSGLDYSNAIGTSTEMIVSAVYSTV